MKSHARSRASGVVLAGAAALLAACGGPPVDPALLRAGREAYLDEGCVACHGADRQGTRSAPRIDSLRHWDEAELAAFLRDPTAFLGRDRRLAELAGRYPARMGGLPRASDEKLRALVTYLRSR